MAVEYCPNCGAKLEKKWKFCPECDFNLSAKKSKPAVEVTKKESSIKKKLAQDEKIIETVSQRSKIFIVLIIALVLIIASFLLFFKGYIIDSDGDSYVDSNDAFPNDPTEWKDTDSDGVGDNSDAFPSDPKETKDSDKDGYGDNSDVFPHDATEWADSDGDGYGDNSDAFPTDATEWTDSDGDGVGDNSDDFPLDPTKYTNTFYIYTGAFPADVNPTYKNVVRDAMDYWTAREGYTFTVYSETMPARAGFASIQWVKEYSNILGTWTGPNQGFNVLTIGLGDSKCFGTWQAYTYATVLHIAEHEFGHLLGYDHSSDASDLMYAMTSTKYETDYDESTTLSPGWVQYYPVCSHASVATYTFEVTADSPVGVYIMPSKNDYDLLIAGELYQYYPSCSVTSGVYNYMRTCTISTQGVIVIENKGADTVRITTIAKEA
jgi:hypothetical protein